MTIPVVIAATLIIAAIIRTERVIMSDIQDAVDAVTAQLGKAKTEIVAAINELETREPDVDLTALKAAAQALDDVVPDAE